MSELLQRPVLRNSFLRRSHKIESNIQHKINIDDDKKTKLIKSICDSEKISTELKSVELVKNIKPKERKVGRDECMNPEMQHVNKQMVQITNPLPLKAKMQSVKGRDDQIADGKYLKFDSAQPLVQASKENDSDQTLTSAVGSISCQSNEGGYSSLVVHN